MQYAIFCYRDEKSNAAPTSHSSYRILTRLHVLEDRLKRMGKLVTAVTLSSTTAALTLRMDRDPPAFTSGPHHQTPEQIFRFYIVECETPEEARALSRGLSEVYVGGNYEMRPIKHLEFSGPVSGDRVPLD